MCGRADVKSTERAGIFQQDMEEQRELKEARASQHLLQLR